MSHEPGIGKTIQAGNVDAVRAWLDDAGDVNAPNAKGMTPLMLAIFLKQPEIRDLLLARGADLGLRQPSTGWRALHFAAVNGHVDALEALLAAGDAYHHPDDWKALAFAVQYRSRDTVRILLEGGAPPDPRDEDGRTPLMRAARNSDAVLVELLLEHGASVTHVDTDGWSALHHAATKANASNVRLLLARGADPELAATDARTPRDLAREAGRKPILAALGA